MADEATPTGGEPDVNTDEGFNRFIAGQVGTELSEEQVESLRGSDPDVASGLEYPESQPRDEQGRFAPKQEEPAAPPAEEAAPTGGEEAPDPLAEYVARHGGDERAALAAALKENENAQSLVGRHGTEVGELREQLAELRGRLEATPQVAPPQAPTAPLVSLGQIHQAIGEADDPRAAGPAVMNWVVHNSPDLIEDTLAAWSEYDPVGAARFGARMDAFEIVGRAELSAPETPAAASDPWVERKKIEESVSQSVNAVRQGIPAEDWNRIRPVFSEELDKAPAFVKEAAFGMDEQKRVDALQTVLGLAQARVTREAATQAANESAAHAAATKTSAQVISGALRPAEEPASDERTPEQVSKLLREALLATDSTSIAEGLTYSK